MKRRLAILASLLALAAGAAIAAPAPVARPGCASPAQAVQEESFVAIGGIEQWVTVSGGSCANPLVLFLHGGPGNTLSPFAASIYDAWEPTFTLVQWDQRAAGKTFWRSPPAADSTLGVERMTQDGIELAEYLTGRFGQRKIVLVGSSWGSILGIHMVRSRPDLFHAYIGVAQVVSYRENQAASYARVVALARAAADGTTLGALEAIGPPPWTNSRNFGVLRRAVRSYEAKVSTPAPESFWVPSPAYDTPEFNAAYEQGEEFSFLQFVGLNGDGMFAGVELPRLGTDFGIPVFFIQGAEDLLATPEVARRYFDSITAPAKAFVVVPGAGHDPNQAVVDAQLRTVSERVMPLLRGS